MSQTDLTAQQVPAAVAGSGAQGAGIRGAIARAAQATGVDFSYLLAQARLESSLNPQARATTSSAAGLYQFTKGTWGAMLARHGIGLGSIGTAGAPASGAQLSHQALMALRYNPEVSARMAAELAGDNSAALTASLGRSPSSAELYLAHFLGAGGATHFLSALATDPDQAAAALLPHAAAANRGVFFDAGGAPRSLGQVMALVQSRMDAALGGTDSGAATMAGDPGVTETESWPMAQQLTGQAALTDDATPVAPAAAASGDSSMANTLRDAFGLAGDGSAADAAAAPDFVRSAYGRLQALGF